MSMLLMLMLAEEASEESGMNNFLPFPSWKPLLPRRISPDEPAWFSVSSLGLFLPQFYRAPGPLVPLQRITY